MLQPSSKSLTCVTGTSLSSLAERSIWEERRDQGHINVKLMIHDFWGAQLKERDMGTTLTPHVAPVVHHVSSLPLPSVYVSVFVLVHVLSSNPPLASLPSHQLLLSHFAVCSNGTLSSSPHRNHSRIFLCCVFTHSLGLFILSLFLRKKRFFLFSHF